MGLNLVFAGTPPFAATILQALIQSPHNILAVYTQPDRPSGRGQQMTASRVKQLAQAHDLPCYQPETLKQADAATQLQALAPDLMIVVAYGLLLPATILSIPRYGCMNVHASLLPRFRGAAPIQHAILAGDPITGITIMQMDVGMDTGPMYQQAPCVIGREDTTEALLMRLADLGAITLLDSLERLMQGKLTATPQDPHQATLAPKIAKTQGCLDWTQPAEVLERCVRAFNPWPVAYTLQGTTTLRIWKAIAYPGIPTTVSPGKIQKITGTAIEVATGQGVLHIHEIQFPGGKRMPISDIPPTHLNKLCSEW
jgi:methionyl-tRNA formyltransferase